MTTESLLLALALTAVLAAVWLVAKVHRALEGLSLRLDEQNRHGEHLSNQLREQARDTDEVVRRLDHDVREQQAEARETLLERLAAAREQQQSSLHRFEQSLAQSFSELRQSLEQRHTAAVGSQQEALDRAIGRVQQQLSETLSRTTAELGTRMDALTAATDKKLLEISGQVDRRLAEGFEKTTATFTEIVQRIAVIDAAQQKITELSSCVVSLQEVLADRSARGAFGEVQLEALVRNLLPEAAFKMQYTLKNDNRVDCILFLPSPTGNVPIDSKFPLENYRRKIDSRLGVEERKAADAAFVRDVRTHIQAIADKYVAPPETSDGAVMFIPAEAVFAEIHSMHPNLVDEAHRARVWMCSPTTLMAILTTARAVLKDEATRQQVHIIQEHLRLLATDFERFRGRMDQLATHIRQAGEDVDLVHKSARKITSRFSKIEQLDLENSEAPAPLTPDADDGPDELRAHGETASS